MESFTAHQIKTPEARKIIERLHKEIGNKDIRFYPGLSYRHLLVINSKILSSKQIQISNLKTTPPHDITGKSIHKYLPKSELLIKLMNESDVILHDMKTKANMIWPWGQGKTPQMPSFKKRYGKKAAVITAVHLLKGLGKLLGMEVINVPGATGYLDTNFKGKAEYALKALKRNDVVFVHVEAPDEAGHEGDVKAKIKAIEDFDRLVVGTILKEIGISGYRGDRVSGYQDVRILVLPDHPTPIKLMTHTSAAVPFVIYPMKAHEGPKGFNEKALRKVKLRVKQGDKLLSLLFS